MYVNSAYRHNSRLDYKDKTHPLEVGSCGTYRLITRPILPTHRPRGRLDYQLLYVAAGKAHFFFSGEERIVTAGNMVLYRPKEEQKYRYYGKDQTEVFWVHFHREQRQEYPARLRHCRYRPGGLYGDFTGIQADFQPND